MERKTEGISLSLLISRINGLSSDWVRSRGINPYQLKPLYALYLDNSMTQKQISESCAIPKQTVCNAIRELKAKGYVVLETSENDKRDKHIILTETGKAYLDELTAPIIDLENRIIEHMGNEAYKALITGLNAYAETMEMEVMK